ncbi:MAG: phosphoadenylyl-sulfate reductase [Mariprofundales bacterium]
MNKQALAKSAHVIEAKAIIIAALAAHENDLVYGSSFGTESPVMLHLMQEYAPSVPVMTLDTGRLPQETYDFIEQASEFFNITKLQITFPDCQAVQDMVNMPEQGINLFYKSIALRKQCCQIRKVEPMKRALAEYGAWFTGRRRGQSTTRSDLSAFEADDPVFGLPKYNPLYNWNRKKVQEYIKVFSLPQHPLLNKGYVSIGCAPCSRAIAIGEDERAGRWWWEQQDSAAECGLHMSSITDITIAENGINGDGI